MHDHHHAPLWALSLAFAVGVLVVVQSRSNGELAVAVQDGLFAAVLSFGVGALILLVVIGLRPATRRALGTSLPALLRSRQLRWWHLIGGLGGALLVAGRASPYPFSASRCSRSGWSRATPGRPWRWTASASGRGCRGR